MKRREFTVRQGNIKEKVSVSDKLSYEDWLKHRINLKNYK